MSGEQLLSVLKTKNVWQYQTAGDSAFLFTSPSLSYRGNYGCNNIMKFLHFIFRLTLSFKTKVKTEVRFKTKVNPNDSDDKVRFKT